MTAFLIRLDGHNGTEFARPMYWTGTMLWPVYQADASQARRFDTKVAAREVLIGFKASGFKASGFDGAVVAA